MSTVNYKRYVKDTVLLTRSLIIKSDLASIQMNKMLTELNYSVSEHEPNTWKYYLNLAGEYHPLDQPMTVISLDTGESIPFTKSALINHVTTKEAYSYKGSYYTELVNDFPDQEMLIRGIINPIDINIAINSPNGTILHYDSQLVESNEDNLIPELQGRINAFMNRWDNPAYSEIDDLYLPANLAMLFYNIPSWLSNIRLKNCKTRYAHSFHIREYLKSNGRLDVFVDYLTKKQALFLYRNIKYINKNVGKQEIFNWLSENILSNRGIGLAKFNIRHNLTDLITNLHPTVEFIRTPLNRYHRSSRSESHTFDDVLYKERDLARRNSEVESDTIITDTKRITRAKRDKCPTKLLESALIDWEQTTVITRYDFLLNHWAYWASTGRYNSTITVTHPRTGDLVNISIKDSFIVFLYCLNRSFGNYLEYIPDIMSIGVRKHPTPNFETLRKLASKEFVSDDLINEIASWAVTNTPLLSPGSFVEAADYLHQEFYKHRYYFSLQEHPMARGQVQGVIDHLYMNVLTKFVEEPTTYESWLYTSGHGFDSLTTLECEQLAVTLLNSATGMNLNRTYSISDIQRALIKLMSQLSSYSVQYSVESNPSPIFFWDWPTIRVGTIEGTFRHIEKVPVLSNNNTLKSFYSYISNKLEKCDIDYSDIDFFGSAKVKYTIQPSMESVTKSSAFLQIVESKIRMDIKSFTEIPV